MLYTALVASWVMDGAEGFEESGSRPALVAALLATNLVLMLLPPLVSLLVLTGMIG